MTRWDAARVRSHQLPRKYKSVAPVGDDRLNFVCHGTNGEHIVLPHRVTSGDRVHCKGCGYHVCACDRDWLEVGDVLCGKDGPHRNQWLVVSEIHVWRDRAECGEGLLGVLAIDATGRDGTKRPKWWRNGYLRESFSRLSPRDDKAARDLSELVLFRESKRLRGAELNGPIIDEAPVLKTVRCKHGLDLRGGALCSFCLSEQGPFVLPRHRMELRLPEDPEQRELALNVLMHGTTKPQSPIFTAEQDAQFKAKLRKERERLVRLHRDLTERLASFESPRNMLDQFNRLMSQ